MTIIAFDPLPYDPKIWADDPVRLRYGTCYPYMLGDTACIMAQPFPGGNPGCLAGKVGTENTLEELISLSVADKLVYCGDDLKVMPGHFPGALFYPYGSGVHEYHWLRMNPDGTWSCKEAFAPPTIITRDGTPVYDVKDIEIGMLTPEGRMLSLRFAGFFNVSRKLTIAKGKVLRAIDRAAITAQRGGILTFGNAGVEVSKFWRDTAPKRQALQTRRGPKFVIPVG